MKKRNCHELDCERSRGRGQLLFIVRLGRRVSHERNAPDGPRVSAIPPPLFIIFNVLLAFTFPVDNAMVATDSVVFYQANEPGSTLYVAIVLQRNLDLP